MAQGFITTTQALAMTVRCIAKTTSISSLMGDGVIVEMQSGEWLAYPLYAPQSTTYQLSIWASSAVVGRHLSVSIDGVEVALKVPQPLRRKLPLGPVYLDAGAHTLTVWGGVHDGAVFDAFEIALTECTDDRHGWLLRRIRRGLPR